MSNTLRFSPAEVRQLVATSRETTETLRSEAALLDGPLAQASMLLRSESSSVAADLYVMAAQNETEVSELSIRLAVFEAVLAMVQSSTGGKFVADNSGNCKYNSTPLANGLPAGVQICMEPDGSWAEPNYIERPHMDPADYGVPEWTPQEVVWRASRNAALAQKLNVLDEVANMSWEEFQIMQEYKHLMPEWDWSSDGCSDNDIVTWGEPSCTQHDFIYRNTSAIDAEFGLDGRLTSGSAGVKEIADEALGDEIGGLRGWLVEQGVIGFGNISQQDDD